MNIENISTAWDFVERYYPNYYSCDAILYNDKLQMIVDGEWENSEMATDIFNELKELLEAVDDIEVMEEARVKLFESNAKIYEKAIEGFIAEMKGD